MKERPIKEHKRRKLLAELNHFTNDKEVGFVFVRGRRRVGKSWLLSNWQESNPRSIFYFAGKADARGRTHRTEFANSWCRFINNDHLNQIRKELLTWDFIFTEIILNLRKSKKRITLIFDEIQWISADGSGLVGSLKSAWVNIQRYNLANIIICGSSNKFFSTKTGGEETILRGMATRSNIWVPPFSLKETRDLCFPSWKPKEIIMTYMFLGGIPYYLNQIREEDGFIHAINSAIFSKEGIFLKEVDEMLRLEFNKAGAQTVNSILRIIGNSSASQAEVRRKLKLASSTISDVFDKLARFELIFPVNDLGLNSSRRLIRQGRETRYRVKDFYLRFFFSVVEPLSTAIRNNINSRTLLFPNRVMSGSSSSFHIMGFSGLGFERLAEYLIENATVKSSILKKMKLKDYDFEIGSHRTANTQVDLVIRHASDRTVRIIECKFGREKRSDIDDLLAKQFPLKESEHRMNILFYAENISSKFYKYAKEKGVTVLGLPDLF